MTTKQSKAIQQVVENGGNVSKAMVAAGYSEATAHNPSKLTSSKAYKSMYAEQLQKHQVTTDQFFKNIGDGMVATKIVVHGKDKDAFTDEIVDHTTRLAANKQAEKYLFDDKEPQPSPVIDNTALLEAIKNGNIEELQRIVFKKDDTESSS